MGKLIGFAVQLAIAFFAIQFGLDYLKRWQSTVNFDDLQQRNGIVYLPNNQSPFSGFAQAKNGDGTVTLKLKIENGQVRKREEFYNNGNKKLLMEIISVENFTSKEWHENGRLKMEASRQGNMINERTFYDNGQLEKSVQYNADGSGVVWISYDRDGNRLK